MKNKLYILLFGAALIVAMTACEPKYNYNWSSYVIMDNTDVSVSEDAGTLTLGVRAYSHDGTPNTEVTFTVEDGEGDNGAKQGVDFTIVSPANGLIVFDGDTTATITFRISDANVGIYTGKKTFKVTLQADNITNGYQLGGAYYTNVSITDTDKNTEGDSIFGTYAASGPEYASSTTTKDATWQLDILEHSDPNLVYVDGLVPGYTGYAASGDYRFAAYGWLEDDDQTLVIPSQVLDTQVNSSSGTYYVGYTPVVQFSGGWYYSSQWPDLTFHYDSTTLTWTSDYGVFLAGFPTQELSSSFVFFDAVAPSITLVKVE